jgi:hypothetical protein
MPTNVPLFTTRIDRSGGPSACHPWNGPRDKDGYGKWGKAGVRANRVALELKLRRALHPGMQALHTCDTPECCNPEHLYEGTHAEN